MRKRIFAPRAMGFLLLAMLGGCAASPVCIGGRSFTAPYVLFAGPPKNCAPAPETPQLAVQEPTAAFAGPPAYQRAKARLDRAYQRLSTHMRLAGQLALSHEQTVWLNHMEAVCAPAGNMDFRCAARLTEARTRQLDALPLPAQPLPATPAVARLPAPPPSPAPVPPGPAPAAQSEVVTVAATTMPWIWRPGGLNQQFRFGYPNGTPPVRVKLPARAGARVTLRYLGGQIAIGAGSPGAGGMGYAGLYDHGQAGALGPFPSSYMQPYPINLGALVGVFTDAGGGIVGKPFAIGAGVVTRGVPPGASWLQLGINDDVFGGVTPETRNSGFFRVLVTVRGPPGAP